MFRLPITNRFFFIFYSLGGFGAVFFVLSFDFGASVFFVSFFSAALVSVFGFAFFSPAL